MNAYEEHLKQTIRKYHPYDLSESVIDAAISRMCEGRSMFLNNSTNGTPSKLIVCERIDRSYYESLLTLARVQPNWFHIGSL